MSGEKQNIILVMKVFRRELPAAFVLGDAFSNRYDNADGLDGDDYEMSAREFDEYLSELMKQLAEKKPDKKTDAEILAGNYSEGCDDYDPYEFISADAEENNGMPDNEYNTEDYEMTTPAVLFTRDGCTVIAYDESELTGMKGSHTEISFSNSSPELVSMNRSGVSGTSLVFEQGRRHISVYSAPIQFEICTHTVRVKNSLLTDGKLSLEYVIEIRGVNAQYSKLDFTVIFNENGDL